MLMRHSRVLLVLALCEAALVVAVAQDCTITLVKGLPLTHMVDKIYPAALAIEVVGTPPITYQWYRNDVAIEGATNACYQTQPFGADYPSSVYYVVVQNPCAILQSSLVTVMLPQDPAPPRLVEAVAFASNRVAVFFSQPVYPGNGSNYVFTPALTVTGARTNSSDPSLIELTMASETPMTESSNYQLAVNGIVDWSGNVMYPNPQTTTVLADGLLVDSGSLQLAVRALPPYKNVRLKKRLLFYWGGGGVLQGTLDLGKPWEDMPSSTNPYVLDVSGETCQPLPQFFRVRAGATSP